MRSPSSEFWRGVRAQLPILLGVAPFGLIYGILAMEAGLPAAVAMAMSMIVFAGSSQFIATNLFATGTPGLVIIMTTFVVNLRHMLYSASMAPHLKHLSRAWKYALAFLLTDEAYAVSITAYQADDAPAARGSSLHWFTLGAGLTLWVCWQISTAAGIALGASVPESWALDFTLALTFIALVMPLLKTRPMVLAALTAALTALVTHALPYKLWLILAIVAGIAAGMWAEARAPQAESRAAQPTPTGEAAAGEAAPVKTAPESEMI